MCGVSKVCFVARKHESLTFVNIMFLASNKEFLLVSVFTKLKIH